MNQPPFGGFFTSIETTKGNIMASSLPNGAALALATAYATALNVTAASNASQAVLTVTNTLVLGDIVEYVSGWSRANNRLFRLAAVSGTTVTLEGLDTSNTTLFPVGGGTGTIRKINTWTSITQVVDSVLSGGDLQTTTFQYLENDYEQELSTVTAASSIDLTLGDDPTLAGYLALKAASDARGTAGFRIVLPNGSVLLYNTKPFLNETPTTTKNELMTVAAKLSLLGKVTRYAS
jgi:hypothetical protein